MLQQGFEFFQATTRYGLAAPGELPAAIADKINRDVNNVPAMPDVQARVVKEGHVKVES